jgi:lipopolysaccharide transport system ATP-binding protein
MSDVVIRAEGLAKRYTLGAPRRRHDTLRDHLVRSVTALVRRNGHPPAPALPPAPAGDGSGTLWALKDVSFDIARGEVVGFIGRNGAGKSTLLKILARITEPTRGWAEIRGRVGSLLEVGTGFHPELTGRENVYLNGAILGMTRAEIRRKFDAIVAFAETDRFIDTPVKHYSSGMAVRLAFAVAAHLEPEILIVDEVLAVGDVAFQKKCLGTMGDLARQGRTVLFVSHNMAAVQGLCSRACLLSAGHIVAEGGPTEVVRRYLAATAQAAPAALEARQDRQGTGEVRFVGVGLVDGDGRPLETAQCGQDVGIVVAYRARGDRPIARGDIHIAFYTSVGQFMFNCSSEGSGSALDVLPARGEVVCHIPALPLAPGRYAFNLYLTVGGGLVDWVQQAGYLDVAAGDYFGTGQLKTHHDGFLVKHTWSVKTPG